MNIKYLKQMNRDDKRKQQQSLPKLSNQLLHVVECCHLIIVYH